jgi:hypothetical protein
MRELGASLARAWHELGANLARVDRSTLNDDDVGIARDEEAYVIGGKPCGQINFDAQT